MFMLIIPDMTCNHCIKTISAAVATVDAKAELAFELDERRLTVTTSVPRTELIEAIRKTGYSVNDGSSDERANTTCCGTCQT